MEEFKYRHSNTEITYTDEDGKSKTYKVCDVCGAEQQNNYGFEISHARRDCAGRYRLCLCGKCATKLLPLIEDALERVQTAVNYLRNQPQI